MSVEQLNNLRVKGDLHTYLSNICMYLSLIYHITISFSLLLIAGYWLPTPRHTRLSFLQSILKGEKDAIETSEIKMLLVLLNTSDCIFN